MKKRPITKITATLLERTDKHGVKTYAWSDDIESNPFGHTIFDSTEEAIKIKVVGMGLRYGEQKGQG